MIYHSKFSVYFSLHHKIFLIFSLFFLVANNEESLIVSTPSKYKSAWQCCIFNQLGSSKTTVTPSQSLKHTQQHTHTSLSSSLFRFRLRLLERTRGGDGEEPGGAEGGAGDSGDVHSRLHTGPTSLLALHGGLGRRLSLLVSLLLSSLHLWLLFSAPPLYPHR